MEVAALASIIGLIVGFLAIGKFLDNKISKAIEEQNKLFEAKISSIGRTLDNNKERISSLHNSIADHERKIVQSDVVMVHIDETMKSLTRAVNKLDDTLSALQITVTRLEERGH